MLRWSSWPSLTYMSPIFKNSRLTGWVSTLSMQTCKYPLTLSNWFRLRLNLALFSMGWNVFKDSGLKNPMWLSNKRQLHSLWVGNVDDYGGCTSDRALEAAAFSERGAMEFFKLHLVDEQDQYQNLANVFSFRIAFSCSACWWSFVLTSLTEEQYY